MGSSVSCSIRYTLAPIRGLPVLSSKTLPVILLADKFPRYKTKIANMLIFFIMLYIPCFIYTKSTYLLKLNENKKAPLKSEAFLQLIQIELKLFY